MKITKYEKTPLLWLTSVLYKIRAKEVSEMVWYRGNVLILSLPSKFMTY